MSEELDIPSFLDDPEPDDAESQEEEVVEEVAEEPETEAEPDEAEPEVDLAALQARLDELEKENKGLVGAVAEQRGRQRISSRTGLLNSEQPRKRPSRNRPA